MLFYFYKIIQEQANQNNLDYFRNNWLNCLEKWAKFKRLGLPINLQETNNPVEIVNKQVKAFSKRGANSALADCLHDLFQYIKSTELQCKMNANAAKYQATLMQSFSSDEYVTNFYKYVSKIMAHWLVGQYHLSSTVAYTVSDSECNTRKLVSHEARTYIVSNLIDSTVNCSCYENSSLNLPCRHIFFARKSANLPLFEQNMVPNRLIS